MYCPFEHFVVVHLHVVLLPHQEHDDLSDAEPTNPKTNGEKTGIIATTERQYEVPLSLRQDIPVTL